LAGIAAVEVREIDLPEYVQELIAFVAVAVSVLTTVAYKNPRSSTDPITPESVPDTGEIKVKVSVST
jgi:hypothetical protein